MDSYCNLFMMNLIHNVKQRSINSITCIYLGKIKNKKLLTKNAFELSSKIPREWCFDRIEFVNLKQTPRMTPIDEPGESLDEFVVW